MDTSNQVRQKEKQDFQWIHTLTSDKKQLNDIKKQYALPDYVIENTFDRKEVARMEYWEGNNSQIPDLLILKYPQKSENDADGSEYLTYPLTVIIQQNIVLTFAQTRVPFLMETERDRFMELGFQSKNAFILSLIWNIGAEYMHCLEDIDHRMIQLEKLLKKSTKTEHLFSLMTLQKSLVYFESAIEDNHPVIKKLESMEAFTGEHQNRLLLHRALIEVYQAEKTVEQTYRLLNQISTVFSSAIGNNLNNVMKFLATITIVLSIPSIIGAWWGMNVPVPMAKTPFAFLLLSVGSLLLVLASYWFLHNKNDL